MEIQAAPLDAAYKTALTEHYMDMPTWEQRAKVQWINTVLGKRDATQKSLQRVTLNIGPDGKKTSSRNKHIWSIDPITNEREYIGPYTTPTPVSTGGGKGKTTSADINTFFRYAIPKFWDKVMTPRTKFEDMTSNLETVTDRTTGAIIPEKFMARLEPKDQRDLIGMLSRTFPGSPITQNLSRLYNAQSGPKTHFPASLEDAKSMSIPEGDFMIWDNQTYKKTATGFEPLEN